MPRRFMLVCLVALLFLLPMQTARAIPDPASLLRAELQQRRDNDYAGTLDKAHKKQLKAVNGALALLDKPAEKLSDLVKNVTSIAKLLTKAFPAEFPKATTSLQTLLAAFVDGLRQQAESQYATLAAAVPGIKSNVLHDRAESQRVGAREDLDLAAAATDPLEALSILKNAAKEIAKGLAYAAKDPFVETVSATFEFQPSAPESFEAQNITVHYQNAGPVLTIDGNYMRNGRFVDVKLESGNLDPISGPGTYSVTALVYVGKDPVTIDAGYYTNQGTLTLTTFDLAGKRITGTFSFTATNGFGPSAPKVIATNGVVDVKTFTVD